MSPTFRALYVRNYRIYAAGSLISNVGTWMQNTAVAWLVLVLTNSGTAVGIAIALQLLPTLLLSALGGLIADRFSKRRVLVVMQIAMAIPSGLLAALAVAGVVQLWQVYLLTVAYGIGRALEAPARQAFVPEMVDSEALGNAVALNSASFNAGRLIGPGLAGVLIAALGGGMVASGWVLALNALSYLASLLALRALDGKLLSEAPVLGRGPGALRAGLKYVRARPDLVLVLTCMLFIGAFGMNFQITSALMATQEFGRGPSEFGLLGSLLAVGSLVGALLAARRTSSRLRTIVVGGLSFSVVQVISGLMPTYASYAAILPLIGLSILTMGTTASAYIQINVSPAMRGRVTALYLMVFMGSVPLVAPLVGWVGEHHGARAAVIGTGIACGVGVLLAATWYFLKRRRLAGRASIGRAEATSNEPPPNHCDPGRRADRAGAARGRCSAPVEPRPTT